MSIFNFEDFITNERLYKKINLDSNDVLKLSNMQESRIEEYCLNCQKVKTFVYSKCGSSDMKDISGGYSYNVIGLSEYGVGGVSHIQDEPKESCYEIYKELDYYCAKCKERHEYFFTTNRHFIMKVGQNPSYTLVKGAELDKYKNLKSISKYFIEFKTSIDCYSQGKGIAAFVYLRRILENIIEKKYSKLSLKDDGAIHFIDKFKEVQKVEEIIPKEFENVKNQIYSVLSKGVHEYEEYECLELYEPVKIVIEEILDNQLREKERNKRLKEVSKIISEKVKKEKDNGKDENAE